MTAITSDGGTVATSHKKKFQRNQLIKCWSYMKINELSDTVSTKVNIMSFTKV